MTELDPRAKNLIRVATSCQNSGTSVQEPSPEELEAVLEGFQRRARERPLGSVSHLHAKRRPGRYDKSIPKNQLNRAYAPSSWFGSFARHYRRGVLEWSLIAAIMTGSVGAFANWGPRQWREDFGQLAERVGQSLGELVVTVTGRATSAKVSGRSGKPAADALGAGTPTPSVHSSTISPTSLPNPALPNPAIPDPEIPNTELLTPLGSITPLQSRSAPAAMPPRFAAPEPASLFSKTNGAARRPAAVDAIGTARSETAPTIANAAASTSANRAPISTTSTARGPSAFSEAEVNLIAAARSALASGNFGQTRRLLDEHRTTFPTGALSEERETLRALVACRESGNTDLARRYVTRRPQSLFAPRLIRECGLSTTSPPELSDPTNNIP